MNNFLLIIAMLLLASQASSQPTILTYFTEHEVEVDSDYIQIGITVRSEDSILKNAVHTANGIVEKLEKIVMNNCNAQAKKKTECEDVFESSKHNIKPKYQLVRKVETFTAFIVSHQVTIKVRKFEGLGKMTDQLLLAGDGLIIIDSFQWKSQNEENPERQALKAGVQDGKQFCSRMGLKLSKIVAVQEVEQKQEQQEQAEQGQQGGQQQEEQEQPSQVVIFKFEVECN